MNQIEYLSIKIFLYVIKNKKYFIIFFFFQNEKTVKNCYLDPNYSKIAKIILPSRLNSSPTTRLPGSPGRLIINRF
jgi:hypothetical protein